MNAVLKFFIIFIFVNVLILDIVYLFPQIKNNLTDFRGTGGGDDLTFREKSVLSPDEYCDKDCQNRIYEEIGKLKDKDKSDSEKISPTPNSVANRTLQPTTAKIKRISYLPIPGSGSILNTSWTGISGTDFYMSKSDYPGLIGIYFEANMKLLNGNGTANLRIFDVTHGIAVNGSEISTTSQTSIFVGSGTISLWEGFNHYIVQAKSLTSDTTVFESGKLKIVTEN